jgi:hypothetical protein
MSIAKDINTLLDNILDIKAEIRRIDLEITADQKLTNIQTGKKVNKKEVLEFVQTQITEIKKDLNKLTNNGKNVKGIFTNDYYVNDMMQDREIVGKIKPKEKVSNKKPAKPQSKKKKNFHGRDESKIADFINEMKKNKMKKHLEDKEFDNDIKNYIDELIKKRKNKDLDEDLPF